MSDTATEPAPTICAACETEPVQKPGETFTPGPGARDRTPVLTRPARFCRRCLDRHDAGFDSDMHRCRVCHDYSRRDDPPPDTSIRDNECHCSLVHRCALCRRAGARTSAYNDGLNPICGCRSSSKCDGCGSCRTCVGCHCNED